MKLQVATAVSVTFMNQFNMLEHLLYWSFKQLCTLKRKMYYSAPVRNIYAYLPAFNNKEIWNLELPGKKKLMRYVQKEY